MQAKRPARQPPTTTSIKVDSMLIGILSDTHDQLERTNAAVRKLKAEGAEVLFHCGDLTQPEMAVTCAVLPCYFIFGNNDVSQVAEIRAAIANVSSGVCLEWSGEVELSGKRIGVAHGHNLKDIRRLVAAAPDYLFSGHTHVAADWREGPTRRINPGAVHRASSFTVAMLDLDHDQLRFLEVPR